MSLSNPKSSNNPAEQFIEWSGKKGAFYYYDKELQQKVDLPAPMYIIALDQLSTITGYTDGKGGIYSNEVHFTGDEELDVRYHGGEQIAKGIYANIKGKLAIANAKFAKSVYAALISKDGNSVKLVNFKFYGSSLSPWIDAKIGDGGEVIELNKNPEVFTKGDTKYYVPTVTKKERREDILSLAVNLDLELQSYLKSRKGIKEEEVAESEVTSDDLPF